MSIVNSNNFLHKTVDGVKQFFSPLVNAATIVLKDGTRLEKDGKIYADSAEDSTKLGGVEASGYAKVGDVADWKTVGSATGKEVQIPFPADVQAKAKEFFLKVESIIQPGTGDPPLTYKYVSSIPVYIPALFITGVERDDQTISAGYPEYEGFSGERANINVAKTWMSIRYVKNTLLGDISEFATLTVYWR